MVWLCAMLGGAVWYTDIRKQGNTKPKQNNKGDYENEKENQGWNDRC